MTYSRLGTGPVIGNDRKLSQADSELARVIKLYQDTYCPGKCSYSFPRSAQSHAEDRLAEQLRSQPRTSRVVTMVAQEVNARGVPLLLVFVNAPSRAQIPPGIPSHFEGFRVVVVSSGEIIAQPGSLGSFWSDPFGTIVSAPGKAIDAAAGGPQQRARAHAATAAAKATQAQIDAEKASRDAAVAASTAAAQQEVAATTATAKAAAKKKLIKTLAIGGGAFAVLAVGLLLVTGKSS